jgi:hypothetical protein
VADAQAFRLRLQKQKSALASAETALQKQIDHADGSFKINSIATVVGAALSLTALAVTSPVAIGAVVGISLLSGVGFAAWSVIENPDPANGGRLLVGYGLDRGVTIVGIVAEQGKTVGSKLLSAGMGVLGPYLSAREALQADAVGRATRQKLITLRTKLAAFRAELDRLPADDKQLLDTVLRPAHKSTRRALKRFRDDTFSNGCSLAVPPISSPVLRPS